MFRTTDNSILKTLRRTLQLAFPLAALPLSMLEGCSEPKNHSKSTAMETPVLHDANTRVPDGAQQYDAHRLDAAKDSGKPPADGSAMQQDSALSPHASARIMFSGHSLMDNPITNWVESITKARGDNIGWQQQIVIGSPLRARTRGDDSESSAFPGYRQGKDKGGGAVDVLAELASPTAFPASEHYDTLVVTERHDILNVIYWESTIPYLRDYHDRLTQHEPTARTFVYQSWPDIDKSNPAPWIEYQPIEAIAWECVAAKVNKSLEAEKRPTTVSMLPVGNGLAVLSQRAIDGQVPGLTGSTRAKLDKIFVDAVHLAPVGQYFAAATVYAAVYGKSPEGANAVPEIPVATATALEKLAWEVVSDYTAQNKAHWRRDLAECRDEIATTVCPAFFTIRNQPIPTCNDFWAGSNSPFNWPDPRVPLPAP